MTDIDLNMAYWLGYLSDPEAPHLAGLRAVRDAALK